MVLHYEDIVMDMKSELRKVLRFLNLPIDEQRLECLSKHKNGFFKRKNVQVNQTGIRLNNCHAYTRHKLTIYFDAKALHLFTFVCFNFEKNNYLH